jgi:trehalose 6-phosphate phosphatase
MLPSNIRAALAQRPLGLVFDIDGTLSPIAPTPEEATLYPGVASLLTRARDHAGTHVAIITGRAVESGAAMVNVDGITYIGTHGLEWSDGLPPASPVQIVTEALQYSEPGKALLALAEQHLPQHAGFLVERKRIGGAVHYRLAADPARARETILTLLERPAREQHMRLSEGKCIVEIKVPLAIDKGIALQQFAERFRLQGLIFAGDDRTDLDAVKATARLRQAGLAALAIVVRHPDTLPELLANADVVVEEVDGMAALLGEMVESIS